MTTTVEIGDGSTFEDGTGRRFTKRAGGTTAALIQDFNHDQKYNDYQRVYDEVDYPDGKTSIPLSVLRRGIEFIETTSGAPRTMRYEGRGDTNDAFHWIDITSKQFGVITHFLGPNKGVGDLPDPTTVAGQYWMIAEGATVYDQQLLLLADDGAWRGLAFFPRDLGDAAWLENINGLYFGKRIYWRGNGYGPLELPIIRNDGALSGVAPPTADTGYDFNTGQMYYRNAAGNWAATP